MFVKKFVNDRPVLFWPVMLVLGLQILYLLAEVGFNASLLNLATGAADESVSLDDLEVFGRVFAGIGLGLLLFSFRACRFDLNLYPTTGAIARLLVSATVIFSLSITGMWYFQKWLIDDVVLASQTQEQRQSARYVQYLAPAMRQGLIALDQLPLRTQNLDRPDTKTALTLLSPMLLNNERLVVQLSDSVPEIVKFLAHRRSSASLTETFEAFQDNQDLIENLWSAYQEVQEQVGENPAAQAVRDSFAKSGTWSLSGIYRDYYQRSAKRYYDYGDKIRKIVNRKYESCQRAFDPVMGALYRMAGSCQNNVVSDRHTKGNIAAFGDPLHMKTFCSDHNRFRAKTCIAVPDNPYDTIAFGRGFLESRPSSVRRSLEKRMAITFRDRKRGSLPLGLGVAEFYNRDSIRKVTGAPYIKGLEDSDFDVIYHGDGQSVSFVVSGYIDKLAEAAGREVMGNQFVAILQNQLESIPKTVDLEALAKTLGSAGNLSKSEFFRLQGIQQLHGMGNLVSEAVDRDLLDAAEPDLFFQKVVIPATLERVDQMVGVLPRLHSDASSLVGSMRELSVNRQVAEDQALRAIYVPAIALSFSLLFTLTNFIGVLGRVMFLTYMSVSFVTPTVYGRLKKTVSMGGLALIVALPLFLTPNSLTHSQLLDVALRETDTGYADYLVWPAKWVLAVQPVVCPVGNALLGWFPSNAVEAYHDEQSLAANTQVVEALDAINLREPFTVSELQRRLNSLRYNAGPVDGVIGERTTSALKAFQSDRGLDITGYQDRATIQALRHGAN